MAGPPKKRQRREEKQDGELPQKKYYRQRAHANPFSDHDLTYPESPAAMDWSHHYPAFVAKNQEEASNGSATLQETGTSPHPTLTKPITVADIGCGFGGLLFALAPKFPDSLILGMEIRTSVTEFVQQKIKALRTQHSSYPSTPSPSPPAPVFAAYQNISCLRANTMKFLPNFFPRSTLLKLFLCFPDPHFKARKHKARIVSPTLTAEYAFVMAPGGKIYTITDVEDLHDWMMGHFAASKSFVRVGEEEVEGDECVEVMKRETEEGKKVERNAGRKYVAVWRRVEDPAWPVEEAEAEV